MSMGEAILLIVILLILAVLAYFYIQKATVQTAAVAATQPLGANVGTLNALSGFVSAAGNSGLFGNDENN
jgi:uncharacterized protein (UPF0333 family)